jgi:Family of unknown function (DUF6328)
MKIAKKIKLGLDETRMLVLGAQVLVGFQFRGAFEEGFDHLPRLSRYLDAVALLLMILTLGLLILPGFYQRVVEHGLDSERLYRFTGQIAALALAPFAASLGLDIGIATERIWGSAAGVAAGAATGLLAVVCWYGLGALDIRSSVRKERTMSARERDKLQDPGLHEKIDQMLTEARVILPGAQALLGFQLVITITQSFDQLSDTSKLVHAVSLGLLALTIILLMAPAAYHRIVYAGEDTEEFHRTGSMLVTAATLPFALGLGCDIYVVIGKIFASSSVGAGVAIAATIGFIALWHLYPLAVRLRAGGGGSRHAGARK